MKKSLVVILLAAALMLTACQPAATNQPANTAPPAAATAPATTAATATAPTAANATPTGAAYPYPAATDTTGTAPSYPAPTNPDEVNSTMTGYPEPSNSTGDNGSAYPVTTGDDAMTRGNFFLDSVNLQAVPNQPGQADVMAQGSLPTPCNQPRVVVTPPDAQNKIVIQVYSVVEKDKVCTQNIEPFSGKLATLSGFPAGRYTVVVNDITAGELTVP